MVLWFYKYKKPLFGSYAEMGENLGIPSEITKHLVDTYSIVGADKSKSANQFKHFKRKVDNDRLICLMVVLFLHIRWFKFKIDDLVEII